MVRGWACPESSRRSSIRSRWRGGGCLWCGPRADSAGDFTPNERVFELKNGEHRWGSHEGGVVRRSRVEMVVGGVVAIGDR
jgi:hypothetical protein